jgi:thiamine biosynthesis lipoprotein
MSQPHPEPVTLARHAMATRFEIVLHGDNPVALRAAGEEALDEIDRLEAQLSLYRPTSEIAHVNARAAREPVRVSPPVFHLLEHARQLTTETGGAFDITIAPLVRCWGFMGGTGRMPGADAIEEARSKVGMQHVELDARSFTVRFARDGMMIDLGAIGKGYALERAVELLHDAGVLSALLHGGTSTVHAIGTQPDGSPWTIAIERPRPNSEEGAPLLAQVPLTNEAMSVSAVWGRSFESGGKTYGHVIDARTGHPTEAALLSAIVLPSATETDALSTALLTLGAGGLPGIVGLRPGARGVVLDRSGDQLNIASAGIVCAARDDRRN